MFFMSKMTLISANINGFLKYFLQRFRSRSRSTTPPHWKKEQSRAIPLHEAEKLAEEGKWNKGESMMQNAESKTERRNSGRDFNERRSGEFGGGRGDNTERRNEFGGRRGGEFGGGREVDFGGRRGGEFGGGREGEFGGRRSGEFGGGREGEFGGGRRNEFGGGRRMSQGNMFEKDKDDEEKEHPNKDR